MLEPILSGTEGYSFFDTANGVWDIPELKKRIFDVANKGKSFENCEVTKVIPSIGEKTLLFNAIRMDQDAAKKNKVLLVIQDITNFRNAVNELKEQRRISPVAAAKCF
jgi:hypothetical protein